jgi:hypothetical protein
MGNIDRIDTGRSCFGQNRRVGKDAAEHQRLQHERQRRHGSYLMPSLVILDDLPPFHFRGPNAPSDWGNAFGAKAEEDEITEPEMKLLDATYVNVRGNHAYAVVPAIYSFKERNEPIQPDCIITAVLEKTNGNWRIASWVWTRQ